MLDGGPSRLAQAAAGRRAAYRSEPARYQPEEPPQSQPQPPVEKAAEPEKAPRRQRSATKQSGGSLWFRWIVTILLVVLVGIAGWWAYSRQQNVDFLIEEDKFQAVFLSNGQVYFGRLSAVNDRYMQLTNVFYLERQITAGAEAEATTEPSGNDNNFQLLKYSDVLYGSDDLMVISRDDIIRYENLNPNGVIARAIAARN